MTTFRPPLPALYALAAFAAATAAADAPRAGLRPGQRPAPYAFVLSTGPHRGQSYCYVCETAGRAGAIVFARTLGDPLARLVARLDRAVAQEKEGRPIAWLTLLSSDQPGRDPKIVRWAQRHAISNVPIGTFEDPAGPPAYRLDPAADVTVIIFAARRATATFAFREGQLTDGDSDRILKAFFNAARVR